MERKSETLGERIKRIRGDEYQARFGKRLGVSQGTISAWERNDKNRPPSADAYVRLAMLTSKPKDQAFLLQCSGLGREVIVSAANQLLSEQVRKPLPGECVNVQRVERTPTGLKELGVSILMPVELVPNPASTYCFGISLTRGEFFDEWAIVDTSNAEAEDLCPFWGLPVLLEFARNDDSPPQWPVGLKIGMLFLEEDQQMPGGSPWYARFLEPHIGGLLLAASMRVGRWTETRQSRVDTILESERNNPGAGPELQRDIRSGRAARAIRLEPGCKVIGRVITWWYAIQEPGRRTLERLADQVRPSDSCERKG